MAEYGEWSRRGATLSHVTARQEYGVDEDFIVTGINAGRLEYREGAVHGNPYIRVLRRSWRPISPSSSARVTSEAGNSGPSFGRSTGK